MADTSCEQKELVASEVTNEEVPVQKLQEGGEEEEKQALEEENEEGDEGDEGEPEAGSSLSRPGFTSENFKIIIKGLHKYLVVKDLKKLLEKHHCTETVKVKKGAQWTHAFVTFRNNESRQQAIKNLQGVTVRGQQLVVLEADPAVDPLLKRKDQPQGGEGKRFKKDTEADENLSESERLNNQVTRFHALPYENQLIKKWADMRDVLRMYAKKLSPLGLSWLDENKKVHEHKACALDPIVPSPCTSGYRNKCEFAVGYSVANTPIVGFQLGAYSEGEVHVAAPYECVHVNDSTKAVCRAFQDYLGVSTLRPFDRVTHQGVFQMLLVRTTEAGEVMAQIKMYCGALTAPVIDKELSCLKEFFTQRVTDGLILTSFLALVKPHHGEGDSGTEHILLGKNYVLENLAGLTYRISPAAFFQVNTPGAEKLLDVIGTWCGVKENGTSRTTLLDVCCGTGVIGLSLAKHVEKVVGVDICVEAIENAKLNCAMNNIQNAEFVSGKAEDVLSPIIDKQMALAKGEGHSSELPTSFVAIVDPPRNGLHSRVVYALRNCPAIKRVVYVSCNPNLIVANLENFCRKESQKWRGPPFRIVRGVPVDLFPHTPHCELVLLLERD